jgi:alpha-glucosidase
MDGLRSFTWDKSRFPDFRRMLSDLRQQGLRVIAIVDPYMKVDRTISFASKELPTALCS